MKRFVPLVAALLAACSQIPRYDRPSSTVPPAWPVGDAYLRQLEVGVPQITAGQVVRDERLRALIALALANNQDIALAYANIRAQRERVRIQRAQQFPEIAIGADAFRSTGRSTVGGVGTGTGTGSGTGTGNDGGDTGGTGTGNGTGDSSDNGDGTGTGTTTNGGGSNTRLSLDLGISNFELDIFGRLAALTKAERERYLATEAGARATRITLIGDLADAWSRWAADAALLRVAQETVKLSQRSVELTNLRLRGGIAPRTDLRQAEQVLTTAQADVAEQTTIVEQDRNNLRLLVGAEVDPAYLPRAMTEVEAAFAVPPAGTTSEVLLRRPDVLEAEYNLRAENAEIGAARAALFPRIGLTALLGLAGSGFGSLFSGPVSTNVGASVNYSIFSAGGLRANVRLTEAERDAAVATYRRALQVAFRDAADALARLGTIDAQVNAQARQLAATRDTENLANLRYRGGIDTFLASLDAQRSRYAAERELITVQLTRAISRTALYRALAVDSLSSTVD